MAYRPRSGSLALALGGLIVASCATAGDSTTTSALPATTVSPPTSIATTTTIGPTTTLVDEPLPEIEAEVLIPDGAGPFPAVVLVHGGGWVVGDPGAIRPLAVHLRDAGYLTVNTPYALASFESPGFPDAVEDVACAVAFAAVHPDSDGSVAVIGHSSGAHIGALVALTGDRYTDDCPYTGSGRADRLVGLAGPYDILRAGLVGVIFFGEGVDLAPTAWEAGNPIFHVGANPDLSTLIMYGDLDGLVPPTFALDFHDSLVAAGVDSTLELVEGANHSDVRDPDIVGDLIVTWLDR